MILQDLESDIKLTELLLDNSIWKNQQNVLAGFHKDGNVWIAWDNRTGHCNVEEFSNKAKAIKWLVPVPKPRTVL